MVRSIVLTFENKEFHKLNSLKNKVKKVSGMRVFAWEKFFLDQIYNK